MTCMVVIVVTEMDGREALVENDQVVVIVNLVYTKRPVFVLPHVFYQGNWIKTKHIVHS